MTGKQFSAARFASKFDSSRNHGRALGTNSNRFQPSKYCPHPEPTLENCGSPTLRFGEALDFSLSFCPRHLLARPATLQIILKNNAESSFFDLLGDVFSKRFQSPAPYVGVELLHKIVFDNEVQPLPVVRCIRLARERRMSTWVRPCARRAVSAVSCCRRSSGSRRP